MVQGRDNLLSLSVEQESDNNLSLKLLLCLEMALCCGWFGLSMIDRSHFRVCCSATDVRLSSSAPMTEPAFRTSLSRRAAPFFEAASPPPAHDCIHEGTCYLRKPTHAQGEHANSTQEGWN